MNVLSAIYSLGLMILGQAAKKADAEPPSEPLLGPVQWILLLLLIGLVVFYFWYRKKQQNQ